MRDVQRLLIDAFRYLEYDTILKAYSDLQHIITHAKDYEPIQYEMACIDLENAIRDITR